MYSHWEKLTSGSSGEEKPECLNCQRQSEICDYSLRLNWGGRTKRASVDSPSSKPSGHEGAVVGFSGSFSINIPSPTLLPTSTSNHADGFVDIASGNSTSPGPISPTNPATAGLFDSPRPAYEGLTSPGQLKYQFSTSWSDKSPPPMPAVSGPMGDYQFGQQTYDSMSFPAPAEGELGLRSMSTFSFNINPVSQPVSFMRHSVDDPDRRPDAPMFNTHDKEQPTNRSDEDHGSHRTSQPMSIKSVSCHSPQDAEVLHSLLSNTDRASIAESNTASSPRRGETPATMVSGDEFPHKLASNHQLLSDSPDASDRKSHGCSLAENNWQTYLNSVTDNYGLDSGRPDRDLSFNNDHAAIDINRALDSISSRWCNQEASHSTTSPPISEVQAQFCSGYYASPVPINIPRYLSPLPSSLLENPINLMYFHHFLNHTARMLVPHNCDNNPFITVLPSSKSRRL